MGADGVRRRAQCGRLGVQYRRERPLLAAARQRPQRQQQDLLSSSRRQRGATLSMALRHEPAILSTMATATVPTPLSDSDVPREGDAVLASVEAAIDRWLQDDVVDIDTSAHRRPARAELSERQQDRPQHAAAAARAVAGRARRRLPLQVRRRPRGSTRDGRGVLRRRCRAARASRQGRPLRFVAPA